MTLQQLQRTDQRFLVYKKKTSRHYDKYLMHLSPSKRAQELFERNQPSFHINKTVENWSDRLVFTKNKGSVEAWNFTVFDLLMNESRAIRFPKTGQKYNSIKLYPLTNEFGFIVESISAHIFGIKRVNFVELDWDANKFYVIERFEHQCRIFKVIVDQMNPSKFVLYSVQENYTFSYQICKLTKRKIEFGEICQSHRNFACYSNDKLFHGYESGDKFTMKVCDLAFKKEQEAEIALPEKVRVYNQCEWINDNAFVSFEVPFRRSYGIAWTNFETKRWSSLDFQASIHISALKFFNENLIVTATKRTQDINAYTFELKVYEIPIRRPQLLRKSAWRLVVRIMKKIGENDPYEVAREFLPLNSDLRELWFNDQEILANGEEKMEH